jgi:hypothetical protein
MNTWCGRQRGYFVRCLCSPVWILAGYLCLTGVANAALDVGWIDAVSDPLGIASIQRGSERAPITRFQTLREGDILSALGDARINIRLGEGSKSVAISASNSPYVIARVGEVPVVWSKVMSWLREVALRNMGKGQPEQERLAIAVTRSSDETNNPLNIPMFPQTEYSLLAGQRDLHFVWRGGIAPYSVRLTNKQTGALIAQQTNIVGEEVVLKSVTIEPGTYLLRISDASRASRLLRLNTVETKADSILPPASSMNGLTAPQRAFFDAAWLISRPNQAWRLETYQQLFDSDLPEAIFLRDAIAQGHVLPPIGP